MAEALGGNITVSVKGKRLVRFTWLLLEDSLCLVPSSCLNNGATASNWLKAMRFPRQKGRHTFRGTP